MAALLRRVSKGRSGVTAEKGARSLQPIDGLVGIDGHGQQQNQDGTRLVRAELKTELSRAHFERPSFLWSP